MNSVFKTFKTRFVFGLTLVCPLLASADGRDASAGREPASAAATTAKTTAATTVKDVETILDNVSLYNGKKITVTGEIQDRPDARSFVLESGGLLNDEIVVIDAKRKTAVKLDEDSQVSVSGTVRAAPIVDLRRELSWDLDPQIETELEGAQAFIIAEQISQAQ